MTIAEAVVLIVDDELELLEIFSTWLGRSGCKVLTAINGAEALKVLQAERVDALISDIRMPIMDGITLVRRMYELNLVVPSIIFVSGFGDVDVREVHALGVEAMLAKPLSRKSLLDALEASLKDRQEMWLEAVELPVEQEVQLEFAGRADAEESCAFSIGRGGCCFRSDQPLSEDSLIRLSIRFAREALALHVVGYVRWYDGSDSHCGLQFAYLEPECREWVLASIQGPALRPFIPSCKTALAT